MDSILSFALLPLRKVGCCFGMLALQSAHHFAKPSADLDQVGLDVCYGQTILWSKRRQRPRRSLSAIRRESAARLAAIS